MSYFERFLDYSGITADRKRRGLDYLLVGVALLVLFVCVLIDVVRQSCGVVKDLFVNPTCLLDQPPEGCAEWSKG